MGDRPSLCHVFLGRPNKVKAGSISEIRGMIDRLAAYTVKHFRDGISYKSSIQGTFLRTK